MTLRVLRCSNPMHRSGEGLRISSQPCFLHSSGTGERGQPRGEKGER